MILYGRFSGPKADLFSIERSVTQLQRITPTLELVGTAADSNTAFQFAVVAYVGLKAQDNVANVRYRGFDATKLTVSGVRANTDLEGSTVGSYARLL